MAWRNAGKTSTTDASKATQEAEKPKKGVRFVEDHNGIPNLGNKLKAPGKEEYKDPKKCTEEIHSLQ